MNSAIRGAYGVLARVRSGSGHGGKELIPNGEAIKSLRLRLNLNQEQFASRYGLDLAALQNWEQDRRTPERAAAPVARDDIARTANSSAPR
jgi:putative transcriptional regulator